MSTFNPAWGNVWKSPWGVVWDSGKSYFTPLHLFENNEKGAWYDFNDLSMLFQDSAGIIPVTANGDPVARNNDKSGNRINMMQTISSKRPVYNADPSRLTLDKVDDALVIVVPTGGWIGTMVLATDEGTASYGVDIPAGNYNLGGEYFPGNAILGVVFRDGAMTTKEKADVEAYFTGNGAMASYGTVVDFANFWRGHSEITEFPLIDTSSGTDFRYAWNNCSSLTSFPLIDTSSGTNFSYAWHNCTSLTSFPANAFDNIKGGDFTLAFTDTNLPQESIDNILVSLATSGIDSGTRAFDQSGGSAPSSTGEAAIDTLRSRGWTVSVTGGY